MSGGFGGRVHGRRGARATSMAERGSGWVLTAEGLAKGYGRRTVLSGVDLRLPRGSVALLLGPNGAGKTTLLKILSGLMQPDRGYVEHFVPRRQRAFIPDEPVLQDQLTVWESLRFVGMLHDMPREEMERAGERLLERYGLLEAKDEFPVALSWGMRRKATICIALLNEPQLLLADEPLSGLDPVSRERFVGDVVALAGRGGAAFVSTHQVEQLAPVATHVFRLTGGELVEVGKDGLAEFMQGGEADDAGRDEP